MDRFITAVLATLAVLAIGFGTLLAGCGGAPKADLLVVGTVTNIDSYIVTIELGEYDYVTDEGEVQRRTSTITADLPDAKSNVTIPGVGETAQFGLVENEYLHGLEDYTIVSSSFEYEAYSGFGSSDGADYTESLVFVGVGSSLGLQFMADGRQGYAYAEYPQGKSIVLPTVGQEVVVGLRGSGVHPELISLE